MIKFFIISFFIVFQTGTAHANLMVDSQKMTCDEMEIANAENNYTQEEVKDFVLHHIEKFQMKYDDPEIAELKNQIETHVSTEKFADDMNPAAWVSAVMCVTYPDETLDVAAQKMLLELHEEHTK